MVESPFLVVWCRQPRTYNKRSLVLGEVFLLPRSELPRGFYPWCEHLPEHTTQLVEHDQTGRIFLDATFLSFYLEAYSSWDEASRPAFGKALGKTEQTRLRRALAAYPIIQYVSEHPAYVLPLRPQQTNAAAQHPSSPAGRPKEYHSALDLFEKLVEKGRNLPPGTPHTRERYAAALGINTSTLDWHLRQWRREDPDRLLRWERIRTTAQKTLT